MSNTNNETELEPKAHRPEAVAVKRIFLGRNMMITLMMTVFAVIISITLLLCRARKYETRTANSNIAFA